MDNSGINGAQTFHLFSALPSEIRQTIWKFSLYRLVVLIQLEFSDLTVPMPTEVQRLCKSSYRNNESPSALSTCKEARDVALSFYNCVVEGTPPNQRTIYCQPTHHVIQLKGFEGLLNYVRYDKPGYSDMEIRTSRHC